MLTRKCDACNSIIVESNFTQLTLKELKTELDNNQKVEIIIGDYCKVCLKNGNAFKDLTHGINRTD